MKDGVGLSGGAFASNPARVQIRAKGQAAGGAVAGDEVEMGCPY